MAADKDDKDPVLSLLRKIRGQIDDVTTLVKAERERGTPDARGEQGYSSTD